MKYAYHILIVVLMSGCQSPIKKTDSEEEKLAIELPSKYGIYYWDRGQYYPMEKVTTTQSNRQAPIVENKENDFHLLVYVDSLDSTNMTIAFNDWPQSNNRQLNYELRPLQRKNTYKIDIKEDIPKEGVVLFLNPQFDRNTLVPNTYMVLLRDSTITDEERSKKQQLIQDELNNINSVLQELRKKRQQ